ncbi:MAG TPA: nuclear transport factor 2 family protein [Candidatus Acidoferrales bacterium]|nr:nuclear transport factor 2 family protein [Candidatus Acidoferrales bacterium]
MKNIRFIAILSVAIFAVSASAQAQKPKKAKDAPMEMPQLSIPEQIDHSIGEMLGAWQVGDVEAMHKYYADDATWVAGTDDPPVAGWQNYVRVYEQSRNGLGGVQLIRRNTNIFHFGDTAWACYQWEFDGTVNGQGLVAHGQTTLVFVKKGDQWLIVHNHTSEICPQAGQQPAAPRRPGN